MAKTTGPILAVGAISVANRVIFNDEEMDWRIPIATGIATMIFAAAEKAYPRGAIRVAWLALVTVIFARTGRTPAPVESAAAWWEKGPRKSTGRQSGPRYIPA